MNIPQLLQLLVMGQNVSAQLPCLQGSSKENTDSCKKKKDRYPPFTEEENQVLIYLYCDNYLEAQEKGLQFNSDCWEAIKVVFNEKMKEKSEDHKERTASQLKSRWNKMQAKYKKTKDDNSKSGNSPKTCPFYKDLDEFLGTRPTFNPLRHVIDTSGEKNKSEDMKGSKGIGDSKGKKRAVKRSLVINDDNEKEEENTENMKNGDVAAKEVKGKKSKKHTKNKDEVMSEIAECVSNQMKTLEQMKNENRDIMEKFLEFEAKNQER